MTNMVKQVARALAETQYSHCGGSDIDALVKGTPNWVFCIEDAMTAILAMRQPTEDMLSADVAQDADWSSERDLIWKGMIDQAIREYLETKAYAE